MDDNHRLAAELEVLHAMFGADEIEVGRSGEDLQCVVRLTLASCTARDHPLVLGAHVPTGYPSSAPLRCFVSCLGMDSAYTAKLRDVAISAAEKNVGKEAFFAVIQELEAFWADCGLQRVGEEEHEYMESDQRGSIAKQSMHGLRPRALGRRLLYSHHIASSQKRQLIREWASDLELGVLCKIGWPGIIVCEGSEVCCAEYVRRLQALRWKHLVVRGEQTEELARGQTMDSLRVLPVGCQEFGNDEMKAVAKLCRDAGLEALFLTAMKIYKND